MKKFNFFLASCLLATTICFLVGCDKDDPDNPSNAVSDPPGTITVNIAASNTKAITIPRYDNSYIYWNSPNNFHLSSGWDLVNGIIVPYKVSIYNYGKIAGLGNITKIPASGFTIPSRVDYSVACEEGHGYIVKFEREDGQKTDYVRFYVVEPIVDTGGGIMGAKVKYQYPFEP